MAIKSTEINFLDDDESERKKEKTQSRPPLRNRQKTGSDEKRRVRSPLSSDLLTAGRSQPVKSTLILPVTKKEIEVSLKEIDPNDTWVSPLNPRNQSLLSADDPDIKTFRKIIRDETQRDPVLARLKSGPKGESYEIIYGSRRRFVAKLEREVHGAFPLKANVGDIGDADAARLARSENDDRASLSTYEKACDYATLAKSQYKGYTQQALAEVLGLTQGTLSSYLTLTKIPLHIVSVFVSPAIITMKSGQKVLQAIDGVDAKALHQFADNIRADGKLSRVSTFLKLASTELRLKAKTPVKSTTKLTTKESLSYGDNSAKIKAKLSVKRGKQGAFRVDLNGLEPTDIDQLNDFLAQFCQ